MLDERTHMSKGTGHKKAIKKQKQPAVKTTV